MLSTTANPTDGLDSTAMPKASPKAMFIPRSYRGEQAAEWSW
jgi:IMP dehydrogenase